MRKILSSSLFVIAALALIPLGAQIQEAEASPSVSISPSAPPAEALSVTFALQCLDVAGGSLGECGTDPLLPACDTRWSIACSYFGGASTGCGAACQANDVECKDGSDLHKPCNGDFKAACTRAGGEFECNNTSCTEGTCDLP